MFTREHAQGAHALDHNQEVYAEQGYGVISGVGDECEVGVGTTDYSVSVSSGTVLRGSTDVIDVDDQEIPLNTPGNDPRWDVLYVGSGGDINVTEGDPMPPVPSDFRSGSSSHARQLEQPAPPSFSDQPETILAAVLIDPNHSSIQSDDILDRRFSADRVAHAVDLREVTARDTVFLGENDEIEVEYDPDTNRAVVRHVDADREFFFEPDGDLVIEGVFRGQGIADLADLEVDELTANVSSILPRYDDLSNAPAEEGSIIRLREGASDPAGIYHYDPSAEAYVLLDESGGVSSGDLSGLTIDTDKDWAGYALENVGHDGVRVPSSVELTVDDFESGAVSDAYGGATDHFTVQSGVSQGSYGLEGTTSSNGGVRTLASRDGLSAYPQPGDEFSFSLYLTGENDKPIIQWGVQNISSGVCNGYLVEVRSDSSRLKLSRYQDGFNSIDEGSVNLSDYLNEWLEINIVWKRSGEMVASIFDSTGTKLIEVNGTDTTYESGGVAFAPNSGGDTEATQYFDSYTINRRTREYLTETEKGVVELGGEVVDPAGAVNTGPHEAPANAERTVHAFAPANADAPAGLEAEYTELDVAGTPAGRYRYTLDGQGGAYGTRFDAALDRAARTNAMLSFDRDTFEDLHDWSSDSSGGTYTFGLTGLPRRLQVSHDGSGDDVWGGLITSTLVNEATHGSYRITFEDVSFSNAGDGNLTYIGLSDSESVRDSNPDTSGNNIFFRALADKFSLSKDGSLVDRPDLTTPIDWSTKHDISIEYDGSDFRVLVDGELRATISETMDSDLRPAISMKDDSSNSTGDTVEIGQIIVEVLE